MKIAVSFIKSKYDLSETIKKICNTDAEYIHVDVMDGIFVDNKICMYNDVESVLKNVNKELDVHLMVQNPINYILDYKKLNPSAITIHCEIDNSIEDLIDLIHSYNIKAGICINPKTEVEYIEKYLNKIDKVLIMSVEPGKGGQKFMNNITYKIDILRKLREKFNYNYEIGIDGGINNETIDYVKDVDYVISGSFICMSDDYQDSIKKLRLR